MSLAISRKSRSRRILDLIRCLELATVRLTRAALPGMLERRRGAVVNVSSIGAFGPKRLDAIYVASKAFVNRFTESLALELEDSGVRAQALCPGFTQTEFHDAPEFAPYHIKERIPGWLWMKPEQVVKDSLQALGENRVVCVPGIKNQLIAAAAQSGLSRFLMRILAGFFAKDPMGQVSAGSRARPARLPGMSRQAPLTGYPAGWNADLLRMREDLPHPGWHPALCQLRIVERPQPPLRQNIRLVLHFLPAVFKSGLRHPWHNRRSGAL